VNFASEDFYCNQVNKRAWHAHAERAKRKEALQELGISSGTKQEAEAELTLLGRSGQLPWILDHIRLTLTYLSPSGLIVVPPAHNLLHGLASDLMVFALNTTSTEAPRPELFNKNPVILDLNARDFVKVSGACSLSLT
jgi:hypothetical protein